MTPSNQLDDHTSQPACPPAETWNDICQDRLPQEASLALLRHAAECPGCARLLEDSTALGSSDANEAEESLLAQLSTSSPAGRLALANRLAEPARPLLPQPVPLRRKPRFFWPVFTLSAAALIAVLAAVLIPRLTPPSDVRLIALAYNRHRASELRIPGTDAVALASPTRGASTSAESSSELLQVKLRAEQQFEKTPNDPALRQTLGEIALVEHDAEAARSQFEMAEVLNPQLARLKFDLASAYFELAESSAHPLDYARAIDLFSQHLQTHPDDPVALFDRGLCWERQSIDAEAIKDFQSALDHEKDPGWRAEINRHLERLRTQSALTNPQSPTPALSPASFLALTSEAPGSYEIYLDLASRNWLPHRTGSLETAAALDKLAALGASAHHDLWLHDLLASPPAPASQQAYAALAEALTSNARGDADSALAASQSAADQFRTLHLAPALLRAEAEHIYSLQRTGRGPQCVAEVQSLPAHPLKTYSWLRTYLLLELASCIGERVDSVHGMENTLGAATLAREADLPILGLRAASFASYLQFEAGEAEASWRSSAEGLSASYAIPKTDMRRYNFLDTLERLAAREDLPFTEAGIADAASIAAEAAGNLQIAAYAQESVGLKQTRIGADTAAANSFARADALLAQLGSGPAAAIYQADWQPDRAELAARRHHLPEAVDSMAHHSPSLASNIDTDLRFYSAYADLLRRSHRPADSIAEARLSIDRSEKHLASVPSEPERQAWQQRAANGYLVLIRDFADTGDAASALNTWQWFHSIPFRAASPPMPTLPKLPAGTLTLVYARLQDSYLAFSISPAGTEPLRMRLLAASPAQIERESRTFRRLCADPNSSTQDIAVVAQALFQDLLQPFADQITPGLPLQFDLNEALQAVPFAALPAGAPFQNAQPLGLSHTLTFLPAGWTTLPRFPQSPPGPDTLPASPRLLLVHQPPAAGARLIPDDYNEAADIAREFPHAHLQSATLHGSAQGLSLTGLASPAASADLLHYVGHGLEASSAALSRYLLQRVRPARPHSLPHCRLAVLAACRTLGNRDAGRKIAQDDVTSFARLLLQAGATHVLASQWDVDSQKTRKLMARFYAELAGRQTFAEALRRAQLSLQSDPSARHPYFWAAFQLVAQPDLPERDSTR